MKYLFIVGVIAMTITLIGCGTNKSAAQETPVPAIEQPINESSNAGKEVTLASIADEVQKEIEAMQGIMATLVGKPGKAIASLDELYRRAQINSKDATFLDTPDDETRFTLATSATSMAAAIFEFKDSMLTLQNTGHVNDAQLDASTKDLQKAKDNLKKVKIKLNSQQDN